MNKHTDLPILFKRDLTGILPQTHSLLSWGERARYFTSKMGGEFLLSHCYGRYALAAQRVGKPTRASDFVGWLTVMEGMTRCFEDDRSLGLDLDIFEFPRMA